MVLDTPLITTLLAALVVLGITYTISTLIDHAIAEVKRRRQEAELDQESGVEDVAVNTVETF